MSQAVRLPIVLFVVLVGSLLMSGAGMNAAYAAGRAHAAKAGARPSPNPAPSVTVNPSPTPTSSATPTATGTPTRTPTVSPTPTHSPSPTPTPTTRPTPTRTPRPTPTPTRHTTPTPVPTKTHHQGSHHHHHHHKGPSSGKGSSGKHHKKTHTCTQTHAKCSAKSGHSSKKTGHKSGHQQSSGKHTANSHSGKSGHQHVTVTVPGVGEPVVCSGKPHADSPPFLSSPYRGYAEIASFFDHDLPNYAVDGRMVLTTGLVVTGSAGYGAFPAYWSPQLRQYVNYDGHNGYDYDIVYQPVYAAAPGIVSYAGWESSDPYYGYGQMILIRHRYGYMTLYGHLSKVLVKPGQHVKAGQQIAVSGTTGHSTGPHLHFSVYHNCNVVDPYGWNGKGKDPLLGFNGQQSTYLWKQNEAPEILNPLPSWPQFGSGLIPPALPAQQTPGPLTAGVSGQLAGNSSTPVRHLLLLQVPTLRPVPADQAISGIQATIEAEEHQLLQTLGSLQQEHLVTHFGPLFTYGAIRVRGIISAERLSGLPGVASVTGARPKDLSRARSSFIQSILQDVQAPAEASLFPSTYLDGLDAWRISAAVEEGGSYVVGFTRPNAHVRVEVLHRGHEAASATVVASASGAFAVMVTNKLGRAPILAGDAVRITSDGRTDLIPVLPVHTSPLPDRRGLILDAPRGARVWTGVTEALASKGFEREANIPRGHGPTGQVFLRVPGRLVSGDAVTAGLITSSGDTIFSWDRVPGFTATLGSSLLTGWVPAYTHWRLDVFANKLWRASSDGAAGSDGFLQADLRDHQHHAYGLAPGNDLRLRSAGRTRWIRIPELSTRVTNRRVRIRTNRTSRIYLRIWNDVSDVWHIRSVTTGRHGLYRGRMPIAAQPGSSFEIIAAQADGSMVRGAWASRGVVVDESTGAVTGHAGPGQTLLITAFDGNKRILGTSLLGTNPVSGAFAGGIYDAHGRPVRLTSRDFVTIGDGQITTAYRLPAISAGVRSSRISGHTSSRGTMQATFLRGDRVVAAHTISLGRSGGFRLTVPHGLTQETDSRALLIVHTGPASAGEVEIGIPLSGSQRGLSLAAQVIAV